MVNNLSKRINKSIDNLCVLSKYKFFSEDIEAAARHVVNDFVSFENLDELIDFLEKQKEEYVVIVPHFSQIIPSKVLNKYLFVGFHTGNLPNDRGGSPIQNKIVLREYETYINALVLSEKVDAGPILLRKEFNLSDGNVDEILHRMSALIAQMTLTLCKNFPKPTKQENSKIRFDRLKKENSILDGDIKDLIELHDKIRMLDGLDYPKCFLTFQNIKVTFQNSQINETENRIHAECTIEKIADVQ